MLFAFVISRQMKTCHDLMCRTYLPFNIALSSVIVTIGHGEHIHNVHSAHYHYTKRIAISCSDKYDILVVEHQRSIGLETAGISLTHNKGRSDVDLTFEQREFVLGKYVVVAHVLVTGISTVIFPIFGVRLNYIRNRETHQQTFPLIADAKAKVVNSFACFLV